MDERILDYNNYDKLTLYVKKERTKRIIRAYQTLGYELVLSLPNDRYNNIMDLTFVRPHNCKNKDKLQYLQVGLEIELNKIGKLEKNKHSKSITFALSFGLISVFLGILGVYLLLNATTLLYKIFDLIIILVALLMFGVGLFFTPKIFQKEKEVFEEKTNDINNKIDNIIAKIKQTKGEENGKRSASN